MFEGVMSFFTALQTLVIPIIFAIGVIFFIYGAVMYFVLGAPSMDTEAAETGRRNILHSCLLFTVALGAYLVIAVAGWLLSVSPLSPPTPGSVGAEIERERDILPTPNAPPSRLE